MEFQLSASASLLRASLPKSVVEASLFCHSMAEETLNDLFGDSDDDSDDFQPASHPSGPSPSGAQADSGGGLTHLEDEDQQPAAEPSPRGINDYSDEDDEPGVEERPRVRSDRTLVVCMPEHVTHIVKYWPSSGHTSYICVNAVPTQKRLITFIFAVGNWSAIGT